MGVQGALKFTSGLPQPEALRRVGLLLEDVASQSEGQGKYADSLALRLLSLQVWTNGSMPQPVKCIQMCLSEYMLLLHACNTWGLCLRFTAQVSCRRTTTNINLREGHEGRHLDCFSRGYPMFIGPLPLACLPIEGTA